MKIPKFPLAVSLAFLTMIDASAASTYGFEATLEVKILGDATCDYKISTYCNDIPETGNTFLQTIRADAYQVPNPYLGQIVSIPVTFSATSLASGKVYGNNGNGYLINYYNSFQSFGNNGGYNYIADISYFAYPTPESIKEFFSMTGTFISAARGQGMYDSIPLVTGEARLVSFTDLSPLAPVPEPEQYVMLLTGLGLMTPVARRRKSK